MTLLDLIANQLEHLNPRVTYMSDESIAVIEFNKRNKKHEYTFVLEFDGQGHVMEDVKVFRAEIVETTKEQKKLI